MLADPLPPHPRAHQPSEILATSPSWSTIEGRTSTSTSRSPILKIPTRPRFGAGFRSEAAIAPGNPTNVMTERLSRSVLVDRKRLADERQSSRATAGSTINVSFSYILPLTAIQFSILVSESVVVSTPLLPHYPRGVTSRPRRA